MKPDVSTEDLAKQILEDEGNKKAALALLLDQTVGQANKLLVARVEMGGTDGYVSSVSLEWLAKKVRFASQLPLFHNLIDPETGAVELDETTIHLVQQRPLDWSRQAPLAQYLAARKVHKFPPILAVLTKPWVEEPKADEWDKTHRAVKDAVDYIPLDSHGRLGLLDVSEDAEIFALDGQHRLMGILGLMDLVQTGQLARKKKNGSPERGEPISIERLEKDYGVILSHIQSLPAEKIGLEILSAVVPGETREVARRRVRSIFVHVNREAAPLSKGQLAQLDEDDGFAIVARRMATQHPLLKPDGRVEWERSSIAERSVALTTLQTVKSMAEHYLGPKFPKWRRSERGLVPLRPEDDELDDGYAEFKEYWDELKKLPSYGELERGAETGSFRRFTHDKKSGKGHLLFRPVGQEVLSQAVGILVTQHKLWLSTIFDKVRQYDKDDGFLMEGAGSPWYMVLYDPNKKRMSIRGQALAARLLIYMLNGGIADEKEREKLRTDLAKERTITSVQATDERFKGHQGEAKDFDGNWVSPNDIELPQVVRVRA